MPRLTDERLAEIREQNRQNEYHDSDVIADLLAEVDRLRPIEEAMRVFRARERHCRGLDELEEAALEMLKVLGEN